MSSWASTKVSDGRLPAEIADALGPGLKDALDNPMRREILRVLHRDERPRSIREIASELSELTVSEVGYHVGVLRRYEAVAVDGEGRAGRDAQQLYFSGIQDDLQALAALRATLQWDRDRRRERRRRSSKVLTMFRIPRPVRTIRLGDRDWRGP